MSVKSDPFHDMRVNSGNFIPMGPRAPSLQLRLFHFKMCRNVLGVRKPCILSNTKNNDRNHFEKGQCQEEDIIELYQRNV